MKPLESRVSGNSQARFGGGQGEKGRVIGTSPAAYPTMTWASRFPIILASRAFAAATVWNCFVASLRPIVDQCQQGGSGLG